MLTLQYLEDSPDLAQLDPVLVVDKLCAAAERLPFTHLLIGWHLPMPLLEACRKEAERLNLCFIRWQPLLTGDGVFQPDPRWQTVSLAGNMLRGYRNLPEFTFACPNHPRVQEMVFEHLDNLAHQGLYQGFFLDRVRFPSPSADPLNDLTCFCEHCCRKAAGYGLELEEIRQAILHSTQEEEGRITLVNALLSGGQAPEKAGWIPGLDQFIAFRKQSVLEFLAQASHVLKQAHLEVGLDCFSPCLTTMVGQDLGPMSECVDWIKLMTYTHAFAPAGLPFELSGLLRYLNSSTHLSEAQALELLSQFTDLQLPASFKSLRETGLAVSALVQELRRGIVACTAPILAGLELVRLEGVTYHNPEQIQADLLGVKRATPEGLSLSWDLLHMPMEWLDLVRGVYWGNG